MERAAVKREADGGDVEQPPLHPSRETIGPDCISLDLLFP